MLASWFASRRELKRLAASERFWRGKALASDKECVQLRRELLETHRSFTDRILTAVLKVPAVGDEIKQNSVDAKDAQQAFNAELQLYLADKKASLEEQALDAGKTPQDAEILFHQRRPDYIAHFTNEFGFN